MKLHTFIRYRTSPVRADYRPRPVRQAEPEQRFTCPYCGYTGPSPTGTASGFACCGEIGHAEPASE